MCCRAASCRRPRLRPLHVHTHKATDTAIPSLPVPANTPQACTAAAQLATQQQEGDEQSGASSGWQQIVVSAKVKHAESDQRPMRRNWLLRQPHPEGGRAVGGDTKPWPPSSLPPPPQGVSPGCSPNCGWRAGVKGLGLQHSNGRGARCCPALELVQEHAAPAAMITPALMEGRLVPTLVGGAPLSQTCAHVRGRQSETNHSNTRSPQPVRSPHGSCNRAAGGGT
jgi:hypothetical protein